MATLVAKPAYTLEQMVDKALIAIQKTGLYSLAVPKWNDFDMAHQTWPEFKAHITKAYDVWLASGEGTTGQNGYHGANNTETEENDNDSWQSIQESVMIQLS